MKSEGSRLDAALAELKAAIGEVTGSPVEKLLIVTAAKDGVIVADYTGCTCPACTLRIMMAAGAELSTKVKSAAAPPLGAAADAARSVH